VYYGKVKQNVSMYGIMVTIKAKDKSYNNMKNCSLTLNLDGAITEIYAFSVGICDRLQHNYLAYSVKQFPALLLGIVLTYCRKLLPSHG
jgi:hypothetical protein